MKRKIVNVLVCAGAAILGLVVTPCVFALGYGYGAGATGGTTAFHVTNLKISGTGSFRRPALTASGRNIIFDVSGTITFSRSSPSPSNTT